MTTFRFDSIKRLLAALLAVTALTLMMVSGLSQDAAAAGRYPKLTTQECDDLLKRYQTALESGEDFSVDDYLLPFYYGGCGPWGEELPPGGGDGEPSDPGPSNPGGSGGGSPSKPGKPVGGTTTTTTT